MWHRLSVSSHWSYQETNSKKYYLERTYGSGIFFDQQDINNACNDGDTNLILKTLEAVVNMLNMIKVVSKTVVKTDESSQICV